MNLNFEDALIEALRAKGYVYDSYMTDLADQKIAIDAGLLLKMAAQYANPFKFIQEGSSSLDLSL